eukprot:TRINITY_DN5805_c3_g1_i1.p1 TRINITY_DN5805_c3_g1~~TRINITY_DN5805_c3_g1_i1.p1  ORF type:complete len:366 (+),score=82.22 TRINITY_DN5805_c3_g1_i1:122-1219(+)
MGAGAAKSQHSAAESGKVHEVEEFLDAGGDPDERDQTGSFTERTLPRTMLMYAAQGNHHEVIDLLLRRRANPQLLNEDGAMAIHLAASRGALAAIQSLDRNNVEALGLKDSEGNTVLHRAVKHGNEEVINYLLASHADCCAKNAGGSLPVHLAGDARTVEVLLNAAPATINEMNGEGYNLVHLAAKNCKYQVLHLLLEKRADPSVSTSSGRRPLRLACSSARQPPSYQDTDGLQCAALLLAHGATVEAGDALAAKDHHPVLDQLLQAWSRRQPPPAPPPPLTETEKDHRIAALQQELEQAERRHDAEMARIRCIICMDAQREVMFQPCKHVVCCSTCSEGPPGRPVNQCPVCRQRISQKIKFTLS